ncbi:Protein kinase domain containing protein [Entamoeba marina]
MKNGAQFFYQDYSEGNEKSGQMYHISKPFYQHEDEFANPSDDRYSLLFISLHSVKFDHFELLQEFLLKEELSHMTNFLRVFHAVLGECTNENGNSSIEFWIVCQHSYSKLLSTYLTNGDLHCDETKFMTYDLLKIAEVMLKRNPSFPFPKLMLSPFAFVLGKLNELNKVIKKEPIIQIADLINKLGELEENKGILNLLKSNQPIENIIKMDNIQNLKYFINGPLCSINDYNYFNEKSIGEGVYGTVRRGKDSKNNIVVLKQPKTEKDENKRKERIDTLKREAISMKLCEHKNIVKFITLATEEPMELTKEISYDLNNFQNVVLVMEYCEGGDLENFVKKYREENKDDLSLDLIGNIFYQIASAHHYLHFEKRIIHRNIKLENFLIKYEPQLTIKCCDFGFARSSVDDLFTTKTGTPCFSALEINMGKPYSSKSDLYSIGVCLYFLTTSLFLWEFISGLKSELKFDEKFNTVEYQPIRDLVAKLTNHDEEKRLSWEEFYEHPYMKSIKPH